MSNEQEEAAFLARYEKLNNAQKTAVDAVYGPVMVIAGPGTGKTEVLSMRIAQLLRSEAQVQPHEILCLTYTDEATHAMRRRLVQIIGPAAHKVQIFTFHGFCNTVIQSFPEHFGKGNMQPISDLERVETLHEIIDELPAGNPLRRLSGEIYFDTKRLNDLFNFMKKEAKTSKEISDAIDVYLASLPEDPEFQYKRKSGANKVGDLKQALIDEMVKRMEQTRAAANLFDVYLEKLKAAGRYDFTDMILWVLRAFKDSPAILEQYQERFQFILVDEFQDTNGAQSELLYELTKFWDDPNLFVVGDDDQSIYEFQGARVKNIIEFYERFKDHIQVIVLTENYRSSQAILDMATNSINNNQQRLIRQVQSIQLNKDILAKNPRFADETENIRPRIQQYPNLLHEQADIVMQIEALRLAGVPLQEVAVLYAQHKQADFLMALFERKGIPYSVKKPVDVLSVPLIRNLLLVLQYLQEERQKSFSGEGLLFEILHAPYYGIAPTDIAKLSLYMSSLRGENKSYWRLVLAQPLLLESLNLDTVSALHRIGKCLDEWLMTMSNLTLPLLLEKIVYESGIIEFLLHSREPAWEIQLLHTFFHFVRENYERTSKLNLQSFLDMIEKMQDEKISLPVEKVVQQDNGVKLFTAHGAKGTEFEHVFLLGANSEFWEKKRANNNKFKLPPMASDAALQDEKSSAEEVTRRLFYVALTRAKKALQISYSIGNEKGTERTASSFIDEIAQPDEHLITNPTEEEMISSLSWAMSPIPEVQIELADRTMIARTLQNFNMSYSSLSKYLKCPLAFYYENILRVPMLKGEALAFGSAIHNALERFFKEMKLRQQEFPGKEELIKFFEQNFYFEGDGLPTPAYERRLEQGRKVLDEYYDTFKNTWSTNVEIELSVKRFYLEGVPVVGKIDKIEIEEDGVIVIDYKTGNPDNNAAKNVAQPNEKEPNGGDYWRQMVFYKLLLENSSELHWKVKMGTFEYVERSKATGEYKRFNVPVFEQDEQAVRQQLRSAYSSIMNQEFKKGCGKEECQWCDFARRYELIRPDDTNFVEIDDL